MITVRPKVAELSYQLLGRTVHPELFQIHQYRSVERNGYQAKVWITSSGHVVTWHYGDLVLTEVVGSAAQEMPERRRLKTYKIEGDRVETFQATGGITHETRFSLEPSDPGRFAAYQKELTLQATRAGMLQRFDASGRFEDGALSYVNVDSRDKVFRVQAFHTFPADYAMLKVQSWYRLP
ncbi:MAG: DUF2617 family protein [Lacipirellulaceae bacterium]